MAARARAIGAVVLLLAAGGGAYAYLALRAERGPAYFQGYVEGEYIRIASPVAGTLAKLFVRRGQTVEAAAPLFEFDLTNEIAARDQAAESLRYAEAQLKRQQELVQTRATSVERVDAARNEFERARAALRQAERRLVEMAPKAPAAALVEDTMALPGDFLPAGTPVVSLLPPDKVKLRFFVPERALASVSVGQEVRFRCDGCPPQLRARVTFVSPKAEYTPPVIYSVGSRDKLVFMVEAQPADAPIPLKPGQPVDVTLGPAAGVAER